ncbi:MAG: protein kinase [Anaerolineae bacterium]|nr:protein kinase [Anaerolineae bacterium]
MLTGHTLRDRYRIYDRLGSGGAATVYLARDAQTGQMVIVKVVHPHLVDEQFMGRFRREIDLLQQLGNPYIIRLYDWALREFEPETKQTLSYIIAEFVEGHTLADIVDTRGALDEMDALAITRQLALGLADIHDHGIVHRDVKSQNIMITPNNQAKLIDFGIAKGQNHATLTDPSHFAGTLYYAPPEQILEAHGVDHRADIYALGVVLYEMLMASLPIKSREFGTVASKIIAGDLDPLTGVSPEVESLVSDMIAYRVENRIASAKEVVRRIEKITGGAQDPSIEDLPPSTTAMLMRVPPEAAKSSTGPSYKLVTVTGQAIPLTKTDMIIGRSHPRDSATPDIDLWTLGIEDARTASRRHCRIFQDGKKYFIEDLGSMNGTFLNDVQLQTGTTHPLKEGDRIMTGRVQLTFSCGTE